MADLFGAPQGIIASNELANQNLMTGLKARELIGAIEAQPAERLLKEAQARLYGAQAGQLEFQQEQQNRMLALDRAFEAEHQALKELDAAAAAQGTIATVDHLTNGSAVQTLAPSSLYTKSVDRLRWLERQGVPQSVIAAERDKIVLGQEREAIAAYRQNQAAQLEETAATARRTRIGGIAATAAVNPQNYAAVMLSPDRELLPKELTGNYVTDRPILQTIADSSRTAQQQSAQKLRERELRTTEKRVEAVTARSAATARLATARAETQVEVLSNLKKYGGPNAEATLEQKRTTTAAKQQAADAKYNAAFPALPLDPKLHVPGTTYRIADGRRVIAEGVKGEPLRYRVVTSPTAAAVTRAAERSLMAPLDEMADELED